MLRSDHKKKSVMINNQIAQRFAENKKNHLPRFFLNFSRDA